MGLATEPAWPEPRPPTGREDELLDLGLAAAEAWRPEELAAAWEYHLTAPLRVELEGLKAEQAVALRELGDSAGTGWGTLRELLTHPAPPQGVIVMVKDFAKGCLRGRDAPLPAEVAGVLYHLAIAVALTRLGRRITAMADPDLRQGLEWALAQPWLDRETRTTLAQARGLVAESGATFETSHGG